MNCRISLRYGRTALYTSRARMMSTPRTKTTLSKGRNATAPAGLRQIVLSAARVRICCTPTRRRIGRTSIDTARWKRLTVYRFGENSCYFLRECSMLSCGFAAKRLFEIVGYVSSNKNAFAIRHVWLLRGLMDVGNRAKHLLRI